MASEGKTMKVTVSFPESLWLETIAALGLAHAPELVSASKIVQLALRRLVESELQR